MEVDGFLIERFAAMSNIGCDAIDNDANDGEQNHSIVIDFDWIKKSNGGARDDED